MVEQPQADDARRVSSEIKKEREELSNKVARELKITTIDTPLYVAQISSDGASFVSFRLKDYREESAKDSGMKEVLNPGTLPGDFSLSFLNNTVPGLDTAFFVGDGDHLIVSDQDASLLFKWMSRDGVLIEKKYTFSPETYLIGCSVTVKNGSDETINDNLSMSLFGQNEEKRRFSFEGPSGLVDKHLENVDVKDLDEKNIYKGSVEWVAIQSRYFLSGVIPEEKADASMRISMEGDLIEARIVGKRSTITPGSQASFNYELYTGPKSYTLLKKLKNNLHRVVNFGWFDIIAKPCLTLMNFIYNHVISNYGVAIILLTLLIKLIFWPLGTKSYRSMHEMKKLQPLMAELREKHKNDKQKMNQEVMNLYKLYKVNPMSGCLPMVVQMPIFFALYRMLYSAIELRHAPFLGWITDLSAPDRLFHFAFSIPFMEAPSGIPVLTLLMGASMFLQQKMSPPAGDPTQAKMMMMMPLFMTFVFINFSSGLVLYWLVNNVISISQQYYITKKLA